MKVCDFVKQMLPRGCGDEVPGIEIPGVVESADNQRWESFPMWPPDVFAVAATLVEQTSCYVHLTDPAHRLYEVCRHDVRARLQAIAADWRQNDWCDSGTYGDAKRELQALWSQLVDCGDTVSGGGGWQLVALKLMVIADGASYGIGFLRGDASTGSDWILRSFAKYLNGYQGSELDPAADGSAVKLEQRFTGTACWSVPSDVACVLPKTRTARVGCTLRSLSHHLALLPPKRVVCAPWNTQVVNSARFDSHAFNLLIIPYPFVISGNEFEGQGIAENESPSKFGLFGIRQTWLSETSPEEFAQFVVEMVERAEREVERVDVVVLPELALNSVFYSHMVQRFASDAKVQVQIAIAGVLGRSEKRGISPEESSENASQGFKNSAVTTVFTAAGDDVVLVSQQQKHHRWKLDAPQIVQYSLGSALDPGKEWWENALIRRDLPFYVFRQGACFTTLVCEDLARADPGAGVVRAIGPNLVIALLMDGPQYEFRWPGRYALGLADDPGCSVLSVTSLGLVDRSNVHWNKNDRKVALWRDPSTGTRELELPRGQQGLVLSLSRRSETEYTLDGRSDGGTAYEWVLSGSLPLAHPNPPAWTDC